MRKGEGQWTEQVVARREKRVVAAVQAKREAETGIRLDLWKTSALASSAYHVNGDFVCATHHSIAKLNSYRISFAIVDWCRSMNTG